MILALEAWFGDQYLDDCFDLLSMPANGTGCLRDIACGVALTTGITPSIAAGANLFDASSVCARQH
jgi:hypothetical protein